MRAPIVTLALTLSLAACGGSTNPRDLLFAAPASDGLVLRNESGFPVVYIAIDQGALAVALLAPLCPRPIVDPAECDALGPRRSVLVPPANITGYRSDGRVVIMHARLVRNAVTGLYERDSVRSISVVAR
jgi:hypothetical protein